MAIIGYILDPDLMILYTGYDFKPYFQNIDAQDRPVDFPSGDFKFILDVSTDDGVTPTTTWVANLDGSFAAFDVPAAEADLIPTHTAWDLVFLPTGSTDTPDLVGRGYTRRVPREE